jgi:coenzyme PQQ precursor peptide PqqA
VKRPRILVRTLRFLGIFAVVPLAQNVHPLGPPRGERSWSGGGDSMEWTKPEFVEVKMDAEINSYQDDFSGI